MDVAVDVHLVMKEEKDAVTMMEEGVEDVVVMNEGGGGSRRI